jgi:phenylacetate-CoA ligase
MLKSVSTELCWPALMDPRAATVYGFLGQLRQSQWANPAQIQRLQACQLMQRLNHARQCSQHFSPLLKNWKISPATAFDCLHSLPLLTRRQLQGSPDTLFSAVPAVHGKVGQNKTSGSTGEPVRVKCTQLTYALRAAVNLRGHLWHKLDFDKSFAAIRGEISGSDNSKEDSLPNWGGVTAMLFTSGPSAALDIATPIVQQKSWLERVRPATLLTYPSNLRALMGLLDGPWPELEHLLMIGETLAPELREQVASDWKIPLHDKYSSEELGPVAIECEQGRYHCPEHLIVEVLDDAGAACQPGQMGRLVVTDSYNFATDLIRYVTADYAESGADCPCGRGLPVLNRILGRSRNLMTLPDGRRFYPTFGLRNHAELAPYRQFQLIQTTLDSLTMRVVMDRPLRADEEAAIVARICEQVAYPMRVTFEQVHDSLIAGTNRKFEEFQSLISTADA